MVLGVAHRKFSGASRSSSQDSGSDHELATDETVVNSEEGNVLMHIISQLRPGADLSRVTLPTFILEPRSMLERITNFMAHPETLLPMTKVEDPVERFVAVVKFYLSGWHIKPPGVKKPLNPILGETFTCYWDYDDGTRGYYISEQTSHHPPKSSYFFMAPEHHLRIDGTLKPRSKFLGNSAASMMEGIAVMRFLNTGERFYITQPNMYARGILFGKMKYELGDHSFVRCPESGLVADIEFKTKGYFSGTYDAIGGTIKEIATDRVLFELSGLWNGEMYIRDVTTNMKTLLFDASSAKHTPPQSRPLAEQEPRESQRLWHKTTRAIIHRDHEAATAEKSRIENEQRSEAAERADNGIDWRPRLFRRVRGGPNGSEEGMEDLDWIIKARVDGTTPEEQTRQILQIAAILPGQENPSRFRIPSRAGSVVDLDLRGSDCDDCSHNSAVTVDEKREPELIDFGAAVDGTNEKIVASTGGMRPEPATMEGMPSKLQAPLVPQAAMIGEKSVEAEVPQPVEVSQPVTEKPAVQMRPEQVANEKLLRKDSENEEVDEFVDAESR